MEYFVCGSFQISLSTYTSLIISTSSLSQVRTYLQAISLTQLMLKSFGIVGSLIKIYRGQRHWVLTMSAEAHLVFGPTLPNCTMSDTFAWYGYGFLCPNHFSTRLPDLLITINFTKLDLDVPQSVYPLSSQIVSPVIIGLSNSTDLLKRTTPFPLIPGVSLVAWIAADIRQIYSRPGLAALGVFQVCQCVIRLLQSIGIISCSKFA